MRSILISIRPKWCELIANIIKMVEVRKTKPKFETPFKCYIYCTNDKEILWVSRVAERVFCPQKIASIFAAKDVGGAYKANGKVIGEFICNQIDTVMCVNTPCMQYITVNDRMDMFFSDVSGLDVDTLGAYIGFNKEGYGWHISDLVIYDEPKELSEFGLKKPPQSWCYTENVA